MRPTLVVAVFVLLSGWGTLSSAAAAEVADSALKAGDTPGFGGLPAGLGREAVYYTCRACHSLSQFAQQRMDQDDWYAVVDRMVEKYGMEPPEPWAFTLILAYLSNHFGIDVEDFAGLAAGPGREEVFYACSTCHSLRLVTQQRLARDIWDETLAWMVEEQGMPELEADEREIILDYLATFLSATTPR